MSDIKLSCSLSAIEDNFKGKVVSFLSFVFIFCYMPILIKPIWPMLLENIGHGFPFYAFIINAPFFLVFIFYNTAMYFIYTRKWEFFEQYRISDRPWPWEEENKEKWNKLLSSTVKINMLNTFVVGPAFLVGGYLATGKITFKESVEDWPKFTTTLWQFLLFIVIEDAGFYWGHWLLHRPSLYWIHKKHHEYTTSVSLAAFSSHPIQYLLTGVLPSGIGFLVLSNYTPVHLMTIFSWLTFRLIQAIDGHCGYNWTWATMSFFPWRVRPQYHDFHHSHNVGNFVSMFTFWDTLMGTNTDFETFQKKQIKVKQQKFHH